MTELNYPMLSESTLVELVNGAIAHGAPLPTDRVDESVVWSGEVDNDLVNALAEAASKCREELEGIGTASAAAEGDAVEGRSAPHLLKALSGVAVPVLDDPGFWRYVSVRHYWPFIWWREGAFGRAAEFDRRRAEGEPVGEKEVRPSNYLDYVSGKKAAECVPLRMYLRARISRTGEDDSLCTAVPDGTDFWRSHIVRVRTGTAPELARSFVRLQAEQRMPTDELRSFARRLNRTWANVTLDIYDDPAECDLLMSELDQR